MECNERRGDEMPQDEVRQDDDDDDGDDDDEDDDDDDDDDCESCTFIVLC